MSIFALGINHKTANVILREKAYFALDKLALYLQDLLSRNIAHEAVLLSTCNRSELYCDAVQLSAVRDWFEAQTTLTREELDSAIYVYTDAAAIAHMMQVACGLDSMILGEPQILGQMKAAYSESCSAGAVDSSFHRLFQHIFAVAKEIRTTTAIGACPVSVASTAVHFANQEIKHFNNATIVIVGAGETTVLLMRYLKKYCLRPVVIVNRNKESAKKILETFGGIYQPLEALPDALASADVVFSATGSPLPIIHETTFHHAPYKPILLLDIAVPRDIDGNVRKLNNVRLYCIDDLKTMIATHLQGREHAATKAFELIQEKSKIAIQELYSLDKVTSTIRAYRGQIEAICQAELRKAKHQLLQGMPAEEVLTAFSKSLMNKLMHAPSVQLRQAGVEGRYDLLRLAKQLFSLEIEHA